MDKNYKSFSFHGTGGGLFLLYVKNIFLSIITLGIYSFWARVNITRYFYQMTEYDNARFNYHATGKEKLLGFLKGLGIIILFIIASVITFKILSIIMGEAVATVITVILVIITFMLALPFISIGSRRFNLSRSSWNNLHFRFAGTFQEYLPIFLKGYFLSLITLGIYSPWFFIQNQTYFINKSQYGSEPFSFKGDGTEFAKVFYRGLLLSILTLGIYSLWWIAEIDRYVWNNTSIQNNNFKSTVTGVKLFKIAITNILLIMFTFGFGLSWALVRFFRMYTSSIGLEEGLNLDLIKADNDAKASALADGITEAADALGSL